MIYTDALQRDNGLSLLFCFLCTIKQHKGLLILHTHTHILSLSFSGNGMGNHGARSLAKTLLSNTCLSEVEWDRNETGAQGFMDVAAALEQ